MEMIKDEYALVRDSEPGYEEQLFAALSCEVEAAEFETGLPWFQGYTTALFRVSLSVVRRELSVRCKTVDDLTPYLDWFKRLFSLGAVCTQTDPLELARELVANAKVRVAGRLTVMIGRHDDVNDLIAEELANVWRPLFARMREQKVSIQRFVREARANAEAYTANKGGGRIMLHSIDDPALRLFDDHEAFFRPDLQEVSRQKRQGERPADALTRLSTCLRVIFENYVMTQALAALPVRAKALPPYVAIGHEAMIINTVRDHWTLTQMLLAAADAELQVEIAPWNVQPLLLKVDVSMTAASLVDRFWERMKHRSNPEDALDEVRHREILQGLVEDKAGTILRDAQKAHAGISVKGIETSFIVNLADEDEAKSDAVRRPKFSSVETAEAWQKRYLQAELDENETAASLKAIEKLAIEQVHQLTISLALALLVSEERNRLIDSEVWGERVSSVVPALLHRFLVGRGCVWPQSAFTALVSLVEGWSLLDIQQGQFLRQLRFIDGVYAKGVGLMSERAVRMGLMAPPSAPRPQYDRQMVLLLRSAVEVVKNGLSRYTVEKQLFDEMQKFLHEYLNAHTRLLLLAEAGKGASLAQIGEVVKRQARKDPWLIPIQPSFRPRPADLKLFDEIVDQLTEEEAPKAPPKKAKKPASKSAPKKRTKS